MGYHPSEVWDHGGPIIEREQIELWPPGEKGASYTEWPAGDLASHLFGIGPTPLVAAMRAYVSSKFGREVQLP
jgi:hypothetical protein